MKPLARAAVKPDLTVKEAQLRLGLHSKSTFWASIWKGVRAGVVKAIRYGAKCYRFDADSIEAWREQLMISSVEDLNRCLDNRRTA